MHLPLRGCEPSDSREKADAVMEEGEEVAVSVQGAPDVRVEALQLVHHAHRYRVAAIKCNAM